MPSIKTYKHRLLKKTITSLLSFYCTRFVSSIESTLLYRIVLSFQDRLVKLSFEQAGINIGLNPSCKI